MEGKEFLVVARDLLSFANESHWRAVMVHAYYSVLLESRDILVRWGFAAPPRHTVHAYVRLKFVYASERDLKKVGDVLEKLVQLRNQATYNLAASPVFASSVRAQQAILEAADALALLEQIESDPVRRAAAIASIPV